MTAPVDNTCPKCHGSGQVPNPNWEPGTFNYEPYWTECDRCHGTGTVPASTEKTE